MKYGYVRPTAKDQQGTKQLKNIILDKRSIEKHGLARKRTVLESVLMSMGKNDELFVQHIGVLADSLQQLLDVLRLAERDDIIIHFLDENITNKTVQRMSLLEQVTFFANLQSIFLSQSSTFTLQEAKQQGKSIGRPRKSDDNLQRAFNMYDSERYNLFDIKEETGISKSTLYRYLDQRASDLPED